MSSLIIEVCEIENIIPLKNADKLEMLVIKGWNCLVSKGQYNIGDLVVYCPPDSIIPNTLIEKYNLEYLKKNGRVGTVKLRGYLSQGLILDLPEGNWKIGDNVADVLGITKYEVPESPVMRGVRQVSKKKINPLFSKYTDIENIKHYNTVFKDRDMVVITEKIHGCLQKNTKILLSNGTKETIGNIVDNKLNVEVLGVDNNGNIVPAKIINWFNNGKNNDWISIKYHRRGFGSQGNSFGSIICTPNHQIFSNGKWVDAKNLKVGDFVSNIKNYFELTYLQESVLIGKMLGDGSFYIDNNSTGSISFGHMKKQREYLEYTLSCLGNIAGNFQKNIISGFGTEMVRARTISNYATYSKFHNWYNQNNRKIVPKNLILNPISLAFWYMDDGNLLHHDSQEDRASFAVNGFDENSVDILINCLKNNFGIIGIKYFSHGYRIRLNVKDAEKLFLIIAPYVCNSMQYKLPERFQGKCIHISNKEISEYASILINQKIISIETTNSSKINKNKYDIETETHNFFANEILVHNSNARYGNLEIIDNKNQPLLYRLRNWFKKHILKQTHEYVWGSHNVQITHHDNRNNYYNDDIWSRMGKKYNLDKIIPKDYIIYGEIYGNGIQDLTYGLKDIDLVVFDIKYKDQYLDWDSVRNLCYLWDLPIVPELYMGEYSDNLIEKYTNGKSILAPEQMREGCVIKALREENDPRIGRKILKSISPDYLLRKGGTEFK